MIVSGTKIVVWGCRHGNGLEGQALTEAATQVLTLVVEPAASRPGLVDWLWPLLLQARSWAHPRC